MVLVITTGGTIGALAIDDFEHPPSVIPLPKDGKDLVEDFIKSLPSGNNLRIHKCDVRDSKNIDDAYRENLLSLIQDTPERDVLITHGTDALLTTADFLYGKIKGKRVILTGAMVPLANGAVSDGFQNLISALACFTIAQLPDAIYIVLSDYENPETESGTWKPRLYAFAPGRYKKLFTENARYNRLQKI